MKFAGRIAAASLFLVGTLAAINGLADSGSAPGLRIPPPRAWHATASASVRDTNGPDQGATVSISDAGGYAPAYYGPAMGPAYSTTMDGQTLGPGRDMSPYYALWAPDPQPAQKVALRQPRSLEAAPTSKHISEDGESIQGAVCTPGDCPNGACTVNSCPNGACTTNSCPTNSCPTNGCPANGCPANSCPTGGCPSGACPTNVCTTGGQCATNKACPANNACTPNNACTMSNACTTNNACPTNSCPTEACPTNGKGDTSGACATASCTSGSCTTNAGDAKTCEACGAKCNCDCESCPHCGHKRGCWCAIDCPNTDSVKLIDCCCMQQHHIDIGGWVEFGYTYNANLPEDRWNGVVGFNDRDELQGNQVDVHVAKVVKADDCSCDWGGRIEGLYGSDARWIQSLGLETHQNGTNKWNGERFYQAALPQAYGEFGYGKWDVKAGKIVTPFEYEVIDPTGNFFYSHSYGFLYAGPFTQTGVLATYTLNDNWAIGGGFDRGWDRWEDDNDELSYVATLAWTSCDKNSSLVLVGLSGNEFGNTGINANRTAVSAVLTEKFNPRFTYVAVGDYGIQQQGADNGTSDATWYGINQYFFYQCSCRCWFGGRLDWFRDNDGTRVAPPGDGLTQSVNSNPASVGGFAGNFYEGTLGFNFKPNANVFIRPEVRYDKFDGRVLNGVQPFDGGTKNNQILAAVDVIVKF